MPEQAAQTSTDVTPGFRFGAFELIPHRQALLYDGHPVPLGGRAFDILTLLVRRAGETVTRAEMFDHVWPGTHVHEHNLKVNLGNLRRALASHDPATEYVATISGRGYKFVALLNPASLAQVPLRPARTHSRLAPPPKARHLFGREEAVGQIVAQARQGGYVTIVGPGGAGKTSIAIAVAHSCAGDAQDVAFVDLSTLGDAQFVVPALALAMGVSLGIEDPVAEVIERLRAESPVLIIDNCEHVIAATAALVERIASAVPEARIIATSREPLRTRHEQVHHLAGLPYPDPAAVVAPEDALSYPAVQLFLAKTGHGDAAEVDPSFLRSASRICARLDGLALAIELAAGTAGGFAPAALDDLFSGGFTGLRRGPRDAPLRHQTLEATLDWSYRLLADHEAVLFTLLSAFSGRFSAEDVEGLYAVAGLDPVAGRDALGQLVAKSLVATEFTGGALRYRLVESTWVYASQRLIHSFYLEPTKRHFAARVLARMRQAEREWAFLSAREWLGKYRDQIDYLRAAIRWAFAPGGDAETGMSLVLAALPLWQELSAFREMLAAIHQALDAEGGAAIPVLHRARLHMAQAWAMTLSRRVHDETGAVWRQSIHFAHAAQNKELELQAVYGEGVYLAYSGRPRSALRSMLGYAEAEQVDWTRAPGGMRFLAHDEIYAGRLDAADAHLQVLRARYGDDADEPGLSRFQVDLPVAINLSSAMLAWLQGASDASDDFVDRAITRATEIDHMISLGNAVCLAGIHASFLDGDWARAAQMQRRLAEVARRESAGIYEGTARFFAGALAAEGGDRDGLATMAASIDELWDNGWRLRTSLYRSILAEAWLKAGEPTRAAACLRAMLESRDLREERWSHGELWRVAGLVAAHEGERARAGHHFRRGLRTSHAIGARVFVRRIEQTRAALGLDNA